MRNQVCLGDEARDTVTGHKGIVIGRTEFLYGCTRIGIQGKVGKDGKVPDTYWFDEPQVKILKSQAVRLATPEERRVGGPMVSIPTQNQYRS